MQYAEDAVTPPRLSPPLPHGPTPSSPPRSFSKIPVQVRRSLRQQDARADAVRRLEEELEAVVRKETKLDGKHNKLDWDAYGRGPTVLKRIIRSCFFFARFASEY